MPIDFGTGNQGMQGGSTKFPAFNAIAQTVSPAPGNLAGGLDTGESPSAVTIVVGLLIIMFLLKLATRVNGSKIDPYHIDLGAYNITTILAVSIGGIAILKILLNMWHLPGATTLINFV